jgi:hypothetical protein
MVSKISSYDKATIKEWYDNQGYTQTELAEIFDVSRSTIQRVLSEPDFYPEISVVGTDDEDVGTLCDRLGNLCPEDEQKMPTDDYDGPPDWLGWGLVVLTVGMAGFIGWVIYNAANSP